MYIPILVVVKLRAYGLQLVGRLCTYLLVVFGHNTHSARLWRREQHITTLPSTLALGQSFAFRVSPTQISFRFSPFCLPKFRKSFAMFFFFRFTFQKSKISQNLGGGRGVATICHILFILWLLYDFERKGRLRHGM